MNRNLTASNPSVCAIVAHWNINTFCYKICITYMNHCKYIFFLNHKRYKCHNYYTSWGPWAVSLWQ